MCKLLGDEDREDRRIDFVDRDGDDVRRASLSGGVAVFGFSKSARRLRYDALDFSFAPVSA